MLINSVTSTDQALLVVHLADQCYGLPLAAVERVVPMAYVQPLPGGHEQGMIGAINLHGDILPVIDPRPRLGLPTPPMHSEQRLVLVSAATRFLLWVDVVDDVVAEAKAATAQPAGALIDRLVRLGDAILPVLSPAALEPRFAA